MDGQKMDGLKILQILLLKKQKHGGGEVLKITTNVTYYGLYTKNVSVTYNLNGGVGTTPSKQTVERKVNSYSIINIFDPEVQISDLQASKTGYTFNSWNTNENGTGTKYLVGNKTKLSEDLNLYAIWTQNKYQVTFNTNGGSSVENKEVTYDLAYGNLPSTTKTGYTFSGWYLDNETFKNKIEETTKVSTPNNHTLYAKWDIITYKITYNLMVEHQKMQIKKVIQQKHQALH